MRFDRGPLLLVTPRAVVRRCSEGKIQSPDGPTRPCLALQPSAGLCTSFPELP